MQIITQVNDLKNLLSLKILQKVTVKSENTTKCLAENKYKKKMLHDQELNSINKCQD